MTTPSEVEASFEMEANYGHRSSGLYSALSDGRRFCDCGDLIYKASTTKNRKRITVDFLLAPEPGKSQYVLKHEGGKLLAEYVDRFDQSRGVRGHALHKCKGAE